MNIWNRFWKWYKSHEYIQWMFIIIPLWLQPIHMIWVGFLVGDHQHIVQFSFDFWLDIIMLSIDHLEWVSIVVGTEKFIRWVRMRRQQKLLQTQKELRQPIE